mmetsp:Transcript_7846/g.27416  ORF Transcript_7846/g.27416 Transcript_7846/m.27416 type:complete len:572 (+) Transcript_7846:45-1760(+)
MADARLHAEYVWIWVAHQLVPFADKVLGIAGAMDNRPLFRADWIYRLPFVALALLFPKRKDVVAVAHVVNICFCVSYMPSVWDYMVWVMLTESCYVAAVLFHGRNVDFMKRFFLPSVRALLVTLYFSAAFWKLTTSFLDERVSCANTLVAELAAALFGESVPADGGFARGLMVTSGAQIFIIEFIVPVLLWAAPRSAGVPVALLFHQTINLMPVTYAGGFSIAMCVRMVLFAPGALIDASLTSDAGATAKAAALLAVVAAAYQRAHRGAFDTAGTLFLILGFFHCKAALFDKMPAPSPVEKAKPLSRGLRAASVFWGLFYGFGVPVLGLMGMASSTMYGNVRQFDGVGGNHLMVPTGLLQKWHRDTAPRSFWGDAFGGGTVRLEHAGTNSSVFDELFFGADLSHDLPPHARAILKDACIENQGRYFEFYAARNYFNRKGDHEATALLNDKADELVSDVARLAVPSAFAMPAYEIRRALGLAKRRGEPFSVTFSHLETGLPTAWRLERPTADRVLTYSFDGAAGTCADAAGAPCGPDALPNLPPVPVWLTHLLHPYPVPLLEGIGDEVQCTT